MRIVLIIFLVNILYGQSVQLNEIVSSNASTIFDEDGDFPDWIEIYNSGQSALQLKGYGLSDDIDEPFDWVFPEFELNPRSFLVLFASGKDRTTLVQKWDAIITESDQWSYWVGSSEPPSDWMKSENVPVGWSSGPSGFGYGDNDDNTIIVKTMSVFVRKSFQLDLPESVSKLLFHLDYDDGYVAYLNGVEFSRRNMGTPNSQVQYNSAATALHEAEIKSGGFPEPIWIDLDKFPLLSGENILAIQVHNYNEGSSDLSCIPFLTAGYNTEKENSRSPDIRIYLPVTYLHTNFKIESKGETIILSDTLGEIIDSVSTGEIPTNKSKGRLKESSNWALFDNPTPGLTNDQVGYIGFLSKPAFSSESGFYFGTNTINLTHQENNVKIFYTLDGSLPTQNSKLFDQTITIDKNTVVRSIAYKEGWLISKVATQTYIFDNSYDLPVVLLSADPSDFFNPDTGIYVKGPNASSSFPHFGANFWQDWEREIHFELLETNGHSYNANGGVKIFGGWSRGNAQKSLSIFARGKYGPSKFDYSLFPDSDIDQYESFILRNGGNDWESTMLRDGYTTTILNGVDIDFQKYQPTIVYFNSAFWGIHNLREKISEHFIASHHGLSLEYIDLVELNGDYENNARANHGTKSDYINLIDYVTKNDLSDSIVYNGITQWIDIQSYINYHIVQIFIDNRDWPGNNVKVWRDHRINGKWRWILYDTDFGFAFPTWMKNHHQFNTLKFATEPNGNGWPNPPWSTFLLRRLFENSSFKNQFINTYSDFLNSIFKPSFLNAKLDSVQNNIASVISRHQEKWGNLNNWNNKVDIIRSFNTSRPLYAKIHLINEFGLSSPESIHVSFSPKESGKIKLNTLTIEQEYWTGDYFPGIPISVHAIPNEGFQFIGWETYPDSSASMTVDIKNGNQLKAIFQPVDYNPSDVVINEINYNSHENYDTGDWIELFNWGKTTINLTNWEVKDDNDENRFVIPSGTTIEPNQFIIIANNSEKLTNHFSQLSSLYGPMGFGLSGDGDAVRLYDSRGAIIDSVMYDDKSPWPTEADGDGPTLELSHPSLQNWMASAWGASTGYGTPGEMNSNFNSLSIDSENSIPGKINLLPAYPNPFNGNITIPYVLNESESVSITITNVLGRFVKEFPIQNLEKGHYRINWNGIDDNGVHVSSGVYFIIFNSGHKTKFQKILFLK